MNTSQFIIKAPDTTTKQYNLTIQHKNIGLCVEIICVTLLELVFMLHILQASQMVVLERIQMNDQFYPFCTKIISYL